ncbi:MAG TPA: hypothetical protein PKA90_00435 [Ignavibacteria bacterium]|nr:hypothetical protein [Ignavibacteria bacterium]HMR38871.1 hypothetical protein [Ignavibacteria bacterium]
MNDEENKTTNNNSTAANSKLKITEYVVIDVNIDLISFRKSKSYSTNLFFNLQDYISDIDHPPQL